MADSVPVKVTELCHGESGASVASGGSDRVCLIMGTFNRAAYLDECLQSLLGQTRPIDDIVVVDDGSTDDTRVRIAAYGSRVRYLHKENGGRSSALNLGLQHSKSEWVWFFDDDDVALPDALERMLAALRADAEADFAYSAQVNGHTGPDGKVVRGHIVRLPDVSKERLFNFALKVFPFRTQGMLIKRRCLESIGDFDVRYARGQDYEFIIRLTRRFYGVPVEGPTFVWRVHEGPRGPRQGGHDGSERGKVWMQYESMMGRELRQQLPLGEYLIPRQTGIQLAPGAQRRARVQRMAVMASKALIPEMLDDLQAATLIDAARDGESFSSDEASACWSVATYEYFQTVFLAQASAICGALIARGAHGGSDVLAWLARGMLWVARHGELSSRDRWTMLWQGLRLLAASRHWPRRFEPRMEVSNSVDSGVIQARRSNAAMLADRRDRGPPQAERLAPKPPDTSTLAAVHFWSKQTPDAPALLAPDRSPMSFARLWAQILYGASVFTQHGLGRNDRVVIVLPQGPEMAATFLAVSFVAIAVPINPALNNRDFEELLQRLDPKALILPANFRGPLNDVVGKQNVRRFELKASLDGVAGSFVLDPGFIGSASPQCLPDPEDTALILLTSGTTAQSKLVLLTHRSVFAAAQNTQQALGLEASDRCLNVMPLYHAHGLVAGAMAPLVAGSAAICPPSFDADRFFLWVDECRPTWYTAVPTMHQAVVEAAPRHQDIVSRSSLRFIRSASALLSTALMNNLEQLFRAPVTESYGLSEAMQLTNTPLNPEKRRVGSLGVVGSSRMAIMGTDGRLLPANELGEIVCRGPIVMMGYFGDPQATAEAFRDGWLRTGDLGYIDDGAHLYMTGRIKEVINRGGEKVSPQEVDQALISHPAVAKAVTFGLADSALGEEIAAVVTLRTGTTATAADIRRHAANQLSDFKVPKRVLIVPEIPAGPTGKLKRCTVAEQFGPQLAELRSAAGQGMDPHDDLEAELLQIFRVHLGQPQIGVEDDFFDCGGNSLIVGRMMNDISGVAGRQVHPSLLFRAPTVAKLGQLIRADALPDAEDRPLIELQSGGDRPPLVLLNGAYDGGGLYSRSVARLLDPRQPFYTLAPFGLNANGLPKSIEASAEAYLHALRARIPQGPYLLAGFSHAGLIAFEMARRLESAGHRVALLLVIDQPAPDLKLRYLRRVIDAVGVTMRMSPESRRRAFLKWRSRLEHAGNQYTRELGSLMHRGIGAIKSRLVSHSTQPTTCADVPVASEQDFRQAQLQQGYWQVVQSYVPRSRCGRLTLMKAMEGWHARRAKEPTLGWCHWASSVRVVDIPGDHHSCVTAHVTAFAVELQACLDEALRCK